MTRMAFGNVGTRAYFLQVRASRGPVASRAVVGGRWLLADSMNADDKECSFLISDWSVCCVIVCCGPAWNGSRGSLIC